MADMRVSETVYDALWRAKVQHDYGTGANASETFQSHAYDYANRQVFTSYPHPSLAALQANATKGSYTSYDELGRVTSTTIDSGRGPLQTMTDYLDGFQVMTTNPRGKSTTTSFMAWDEPSYDLPIESTEPGGVTTTIARDVYGKPLQLRRGTTGDVHGRSAVRSYVYDPQQRLCKTVEPETGATLIGYDLANNIAWRATGMAQTGLAACDEGTLTDAQKSKFTYDAMNRVDYIDHPPGTADIDYEYDDNGALETAVSGGNLWTYTYNKRGLIEKETLQTAGGRTFELDWNYDNFGALDSLKYPDGFLLPFTPDARGRPSQAGLFATGASYHAGGTLTGYTFGNGIRRTITPNTRLLPARISDVLENQPGAADDVRYFDHAFTYDANGNIETLTDHYDGKETRSLLVYDDRDRLTGTTTGPFGPETYGYDVLDNIRTVTGHGGRHYTYKYDETKNRLTQIVNAVGEAPQYLYGYATENDRGEVKSRTANGDTMTFAFDAASRITGITHSAAAANDETYAYDAHGLRVLTTRKDGKQRWQVYGRNGQLLYVEDEKENKRIDYIHLGNTLVAERSTPIAGSTETITYLHSDHLGTPSMQTNAAREVTERMLLTPYGERYIDGDYKDGRGFTGHATDAASGLTYMQQRYYDPVAGRFLSGDPVQARATGENFNRYWYANNNPYRFKDPNGRETGAGYATGQYQMAQPSPEGLGLFAGFTPVVGDVKGVVDAYNDPTAINIMAAMVGLAGPVGDGAGKLLKNADNIVDASRGLIPLTKAAFGHTFTTHGQNATEFLTKRAAGSGKPMGQFMDDQAAARLIKDNIDNLKNGAISVEIPKDFPARIIMPDGSFARASTVRLVPSGSGVKTAYPEL